MSTPAKQSFLLSEVEVRARQVQDSRGRPTVECRLEVGGLVGQGDVPAGASKGEDEARTLPVPQAVAVIEGPIASMLAASKASLNDRQALLALERQIIAAAGDNYATFGANAVVPVSRALWQLAAAAAGKSLARYIHDTEADLAGPEPVRFLMNIFNGGLHALKSGEQLGVDRIDIQELMVVPVSAKSYRQAVAMGDAIDQALKGILTAEFGAAALSRADEAGFSVKGLADSGRALGLVFQSIERAGFAPGRDVKLSLDVAASSFYDKAAGRYRYQNRLLTSDEMIGVLVGLVDRYAGAFLSIEDGLDENDWEAWPKLTAELGKRGVITVGDDLFVTQLERLEKGIAKKAATAILIKINQNGSLLGTLDVMRRAKKAGMHCIVSHRSGETLDDSIADLAFGTGALGLKTGDPQPEVDFPDKKTWVRRRKYLRMIELEEQG